MRNLFGEGRHPDAERLEDAALDVGASLTEAKKASQLGRLFAVYRGNAPELVQETARRFSDYNIRHGLHWKTPVPHEERARIRTQVADELLHAGSIIGLLWTTGNARASWRRRRASRPPRSRGTT